MSQLLDLDVATESVSERMQFKADFIKRNYAGLGHFARIEQGQGGAQSKCRLVLG